MQKPRSFGGAFRVGSEHDFKEHPDHTELDYL